MIIVIGCGRVGLPLGLFIAGHGYKVIGIDTDINKIEKLCQQKMPFLEKGSENLLKQTANDGLLMFTTDFSEVLDQGEVFFITVGTPLNADFVPDHSSIYAILENIISNAKKKPLTIILRSTIAPGTSRRIKKVFQNKGLILGKDIFYAYCPERIVSGNSLTDLTKHPQLVGTFDQTSADKVRALFSGLHIRCIEGQPIEVELAKLYNNMYRYVNFALANECMLIAEKNDASIVNVLRMCNEGYERGGPWQPGYAAGPCLSKDGFFLTNQMPYTDLMLTSWKINESLPEILLSEVTSIRPLGLVAILGLAFKEESDDARNSLGLKLLNILNNHGVKTKCHDPYITSPLAAPSIQDTLRDATEVFVMAPHREYRALTPDIITKSAGPEPIVIDPWFLWNDRVITKLN